MFEMPESINREFLHELMFAFGDPASQERVGLHHRGYDMVVVVECWLHVVRVEPRKQLMMTTNQCPELVHVL